MSRVLRGLILVFVLIVCAWYGLGIRQAENTSRATTALSTGKRLTPDQAAHVRSLLAAAGTLNPDLTVDLLRGRLASEQRRYPAAEATFRSVARREPMNVEAWAQLVFAAAATGDHATLIDAARHVAELYRQLK